MLQAGGIAGILVLVYINGLMALLRWRAGDVVHRVQPTGRLLGCSLLAVIQSAACHDAASLAVTGMVDPSSVRFDWGAEPSARSDVATATPPPRILDLPEQT